MSNKNTLIKYLCGIGAIQRGTFTLKSGAKSDIYCDTRMAALDANGLTLAVECFNELILSYEFNSIGVMEGAGSSVLLGGLLHYMGEGCGFVVRKEVKGHGTGKMIEGIVGTRSVLIDDVATSGASLVHAIKNMPTPPLIAAVLIDRQEGAAKAIEPYGVKLASVLTLQEIRESMP